MPRVLLLLALVLSFPNASFAAEVLSTTGLAVDSGAFIRTLQDASLEEPERRASGYSLSAPLSISVVVSGEKLSFRFQSLQLKTWRSYFRSEAGEREDRSEVVLLQGRELGSDLPAAGSIFERDGVRVLRVLFQRKGGEGVDLEVDLDGGSISKASSQSVRELSGRTCGADGHSRTSAGAGKPRAANTALEVELATDADYEWFQEFGASSNAEIASIMNAVNTIYQSELGLSYTIVRQNVWDSASQPLSSTDSESLLVQFQNRNLGTDYLGTADLYHLFSGKEFDGNTIGIAYIGVTCDAPSYAFGTSSYVGTLTYVVVAHELGHNFNADHDTGLPQTIMYPALDGDTRITFSSFSRGEIENFIQGAGGTCLGETSIPDPRTAPVTVSVSPSLRRSLGRLNSTIRVSGAEGLSCSVDLEISGSEQMSGLVRKRFSGLSDGTYRIVSYGSSRVRLGSGESASVFIRATARCGSGVYRSSVKRVRFDTTTSRSGTTRKSWMRQLTRSAVLQ